MKKLPIQKEETSLIWQIASLATEVKNLIKEIAELKLVLPLYVRKEEYIVEVALSKEIHRNLEVVHKELETLVVGEIKANGKILNDLVLFKENITGKFWGATFTLGLIWTTVTFVLVKYF